MSYEGSVKGKLDSFPSGYSEREVLEELRKCWRWVNNSDWRKSLKSYFDGVSRMGYVQVMKYGKIYPNVGEAIRKLKELHREKLKEKVYEYLSGLKEWFVSNKGEYYVGKYFEENNEISRGMVMKVVEESEEVSELWEEILSIQENRVVNGIISGEIKEKSGMFILKNLHRWADKKEVDVKETHEISIAEAIRSMKEQQRRLSDDRGIIDGEFEVVE